MQVPGRQSRGPLDPTVAWARTELRKMLQPVLERHENPLVLIACSGGPDSLALAATAAFVIPRLNARAGAVIVDHNLQAGSDEAAAQAAQQCRKLQLDPVEVTKIDVDLSPGAGGLEASARTARYESLREAATAHDAAVVLLGHTLDDQAEQVLLALTRGSGSRSIAGIPEQRDIFYRPFLGLRRADTVHICDQLGLTPWLDPMNELPRADQGEETSSLIDVPRRVVVRELLLPQLEQHLGPGIAPALARTAQLARDDDTALSELANTLLEKAAARKKTGRIELDCDVLLAAPRALRSRAIHRACLEIGVPTGTLMQVHIAALEDLVTNWHGQGPVDLPGSHRGQRQYGTLTLYAAKK